MLGIEVIILEKNIIDIGKRISQIREDLNMSREKFGNAIGINSDVIYNIEAARNKKLNEPLLLSLCTQYGINKEWLFYGKGNKYSKSEQSLVDELAQKYNLNAFGKQIIQTFLEMSETERNVLENFIYKAADLGSVSLAVAARGGKEGIQTVKFNRGKIEDDINSPGSTEFDD